MSKVIDFSPIGENFGHIGMGKGEDCSRTTLGNIFLQLQPFVVPQVDFEQIYSFFKTIVVHLGYLGVEKKKVNGTE